MAKAEAAPRLGGGPNFSLWFGGVVVALTVLLAVLGPGLAPVDPVKETFISEINGEFVKPPYAPFQSPDFPLGADEFGRDILSRLLWAIQPTLTLIMVVAAARLVVGLSLGVIAGWSSGPAGRIAETLIALALTLPVPLVALFVLAALAQFWGVWAFIVGLSITGWAEVARLVREQTRLVQQQRYVEAGRALGLSEAQLIINHVMPHLIPLLWVLLALEASSALLTSAALGVLGYFINSVWVPVGDFLGVRAAGKPELGQMLYFSPASRQPWSALSAGTLVLIMVLGFNLFGEGLKRELNPETRRRPGWWLRRLRAVSDSLGDRVFLALAEWQRTLATGGVAAVLAVMLAGGGWWLWQQTAAAATPEAVVQVPGGHLWGSARHDAQGTLYAPVHGPAAADVAWTYAAPEGVFGPVIAADGTVYVVTGRAGGSLVALTPEGEVRWETAIPEAVFVSPAEDSFDRPPVEVLLSVPALNAEGEIVVADGVGNVHAFAPDGHVRWTFLNPNPANLLTQPIVASNGDVYFATEQNLFALTVDGQMRLANTLPTYSYSQPVLRLSHDERLLMLQDVVVDAQSGAELLAASISIELFVVGTDGKLYLRKQSAMEEWEVAEDKARVIPRVKLDERGLGLNLSLASDAGVTPGGWTWFQFNAPFGGPARLVWADLNNTASQVVNATQNGAQALAIDADRVVYMCDMRPAPEVKCAAYRPDSSQVWEAVLGGNRGFVVGAALAEGRFYAATADGVLYALGQ